MLITVEEHTEVQKMPGEQGASRWADLMHVNKKGKHRLFYEPGHFHESFSCHCSFMDMMAEWMPPDILTFELSPGFSLGCGLFLPPLPLCATASAHLGAGSDGRQVLFCNQSFKPNKKTGCVGLF